MQKKVLITGGAGFIGSHIVEHFLKKGHKVVVLDDLSTGSKDNIPENVELCEADICTSQAREFAGTFAPDILVHAAAQISVRDSMKDPVKDTQTNVVGILSILHAFSAKHLPHFIFISSGGAIYGEQKQFPAPETHQIEPESVYGLAKYVSELYLNLWSRSYNLRYACLRLSNVYGPRQNSKGEAGVVAIFSEKLARAQIPTINGTGEQTRDFIYVKDVAKAVENVAAGGITGVYNIGTGLETSILRIYDLLSRELQAIGPNYGPAKPGEQMRSCIDANLAQKTFGWTPQVTLEQGIAQTASWFKARLKLS